MSYSSCLRRNHLTWKRGSKHEEVLSDNDTWDEKLLIEINKYAITTSGQQSECFVGQASTAQLAVTDTACQPCGCRLHRRFSKHAQLNELAKTERGVWKQKFYLTFAVPPARRVPIMDALYLTDAIAFGMCVATGDSTGTEAYMAFCRQDEAVPLTTFVTARDKFELTTIAHSDLKDDAFLLTKSNPSTAGMDFICVVANGTFKGLADVLTALK